MSSFGASFVPEERLLGDEMRNGRAKDAEAGAGHEQGGCVAMW